MDNHRKKISGIIKKIFPLRRCLVGDDFDKALDIISKSYPLKIHELSTADRCYTWDLPKKWAIKEAYVKDARMGNEIINIKRNGLNICMNSCAVSRRNISFNELDKHLFYDKNRPDAVPYKYFYYHYDKWGFCISYNDYKKLDKKGEYIIKIDSEHTDGFLKIGELKIKGEIEDEIILISHLDHPFQANDNLSGVATLLFLAEKFMEIGSRYTLRFVFNPETIGSIAYMWFRKKEKSKIKYVFNIDMVGASGRLLIQRALKEDCLLNALIKYAAERFYPDKTKYEIAGYREHCGGDEMSFSDPLWGGIDAVLLIGWPYKHYHSDGDKLDMLSYDSIIETAEFLSTIIGIINNNLVVKRNFEGPLQRDRLGWFLGDLITDIKLDKLTYFIDGKRTVFELAQKTGMDMELCLKYVKDLTSRKLLEIID